MIASIILHVSLDFTFKFNRFLMRRNDKNVQKTYKFLNLSKEIKPFLQNMFFIHK